MDDGLLGNILLKQHDVRYTLRHRMTCEKKLKSLTGGCMSPSFLLSFIFGSSYVFSIPLVVS